MRELRVIATMIDSIINSGLGGVIVLFFLESRKVSSSNLTDPSSVL